MNTIIPKISHILLLRLPLLSESKLASFASFWKPVMMLDSNIWQKWLHSHRLGLVLEQDLPLPKYLHVPNSSGRFNILQCRQALASLNQLLRHWATFVLAENHSYIKLLSRFVVVVLLKREAGGGGETERERERVRGSERERERERERASLVSLNQLLRHWATFVLAENHSYIKLLSRFVVVVLLKREALGGGGVGGE